MNEEKVIANAIPPLLGCLYCHSSETTMLSEGRKILGWGSEYPILRCSHCGATAWLDYNAEESEHWRICYRRVNHASHYYYVALHLGKAGWLSDHEALGISTDGYVQRMRVQQAQRGQLGWLQPAPLRPPPPLMTVNEVIYLSLKGVVLQNAVPSGFLARVDENNTLDTGKCYVTDQKIHLLGQRRDWSHRLSDVIRVNYDEKAWTVILNTPGQLQQYRGLNAADQYDSQLVSAVINTLKIKF